MKITRHAQARAAQRNISRDVVSAVLVHGRLIRGRNVEAFFLGRREVKQARRCGLNLSFARNTQVIVSHDGQIITLYRTDRPMRDWSRSRARRSR